MSNRSTVLAVVAFFAFIFAIDFIGNTFGAFWFWCTILGTAYVFVTVANNYDRKN